MKMRSIYSLEVLQRILDHYHVGKIVLLDGYLTLGSNTWLHFIKTNQGEFELFSFPTQTPNESCLIYYRGGSSRIS